MTGSSPSKYALCESVAGTALERLTAGSIPEGRACWKESDLQREIVAAAEVLRSEGVLNEVRTSFRAPIPGWWPAAGDVDVALGEAGFKKPRWSLFELKWCYHHNKMSEALWDVLKLLNAHALPEVYETFLVTGAPVRWWNPDGAGVACFTPGIKNLTEVLFANQKAWTDVLASGTGVPTFGPERFKVEEVLTRKLELNGVPYEVRAVAVRPYGKNIVRLNVLPEVRVEERS